MNAKEVKAALADEDVKTAVEKLIKAAVKDETKRVQAVIKDAIEANKAAEDKAIKAAVGAALKNVLAGTKA